MSDEETDTIIYPSAKVGAITRLKNKITSFIDENPEATPEDLESWKNKLNEKIAIFNTTCLEEEDKDVPVEDLEEFRKWVKKQTLTNKVFINKIDKIILRRTEGYEDSDEESDTQSNSDVCAALIKGLRDIQTISQLPSHEPHSFDGSDITEYQSFCLTFHQAIEKKCDSFEDKYYYLLKYTAGEANNLVKSCHNINSRKAYHEARCLLDDKYGNEYIIAQKYLQKLQNWTPIKAEDGPELNRFASFLTTIENLMKNKSSLNQLNSPRDIKEIIMKLPYNMRLQFRNKSSELIENDEEINFAFLVKFVNQQAKQVNVPIFGDITDKKPTKKIEEITKKYNKDKSKTFFTSEKTTAEKYCPCCKKTNHVLNDCFFFGRKTYDEKTEFIKKHNICFGCLDGNHYSKNCKQPLSCRTCKKKHPSSLHTNNDEERKVYKKTEEKTQVNNEINEEKEETNKNINLLVKDATKIACPAIPVIIRSKDTKKEIKTYAALDNFSTASYMDSELMKTLKLKGNKKSLDVTTIDDSKIKIDAVEIKNLIIMSIDKEQCKPLSTVYAKDNWPFDEEDSPTYANIAGVKEFDFLPFHFISSKIGILIGMNEPDIIKPLQVIETPGNGPYASEHKLGWAINGPIRGPPATKCFRVKIQELSNLEEKHSEVNTNFEENVTLKTTDIKMKLSTDKEKLLGYEKETSTKVSNSNIYKESLLKEEDTFKPTNILQENGKLQVTEKKLKNNQELPSTHYNFTKAKNNQEDQGNQQRQELNTNNENQLINTDPTGVKNSQVESTITKLQQNTSHEDPEVNMKNFASTTKTSEILTPLNKLMKSTSDYHKLVCRIVIFLRLKDYLKNKVMKKGKITTEEIQNGEIQLWKIVQQSHFYDTIQLLHQNKNIPANHQLNKLQPFIGKDGLLRVGEGKTRTNNYQAAKHRIILHASSTPVTMMLRKLHKENGHLSREIILAKINENFYIIKVNKATRKIVHQCTTCRRVQARLLHKRSNHNTQVTDNIVNAVLTKIQNITNNKPITIIMTSDSNNNVPITPNTNNNIQTRVHFTPPREEESIQQIRERTRHLAYAVWARFRKKRYLQ